MLVRSSLGVVMEERPLLGDVTEERSVLGSVRDLRSGNSCREPDKLVAETFKLF